MPASQEHATTLETPPRGIDPAGSSAHGQPGPVVRGVLEELSPPWRRLLLFMFGAACTVVVAAGVRSVAAVLDPVLAAGFLVLLLHPLLRKLRGPLGGAAAAVVALAVVLGVATVAAFVGASLGRLATELPRYQAQAQGLVDAVTHWMAAHGIDVAASLHSALSGTALAGMLVRVSGTVASALGDLVLTYILFLFMLAGIPEVERRASREAEDHSPMAARSLALSTTIAGLVGVRTVLGIGAALLEYLLMLAVGVDYAPLWAVLAFMLCFVPTIGLAMAMLPPVLLALLSHGWLSATIVFLGFEVVTILMDNVIGPHYIGREANLPALLSFMSVLFWAWLLGPVGAILSVPLTVTVRDLAFARPERAVPVRQGGGVASAAVAP